MSIKLNYSAAEIDAAINKIQNLVGIIKGSSDIIQLKNDSVNIYPLTKAEAVIFNNNSSKDLATKFTLLERENLQDILEHNLGLIEANGIPPTPSSSGYYIFSTNGKCNLFPYLGADFYAFAGDFLIVTKRENLYNYMYFPKGEGGLISNLNLLNKTQNVTCDKNTIGIPDTNYKWFVEHKNSNTSTNEAYQRAVAYSTDLIIYERVKINNVWTSWIANVNPNNYYTKSEIYNKVEVDSLVSSIGNFEPKIVQNINEITESGYIYFLSVGENVYDLYLYTNEVAEKIGSSSTSIDLSNYVIKESGKSLINDNLIIKLMGLPSTAYNKIEIDTLLYNYVLKNPGSRLLSSAEASIIAAAVTTDELEFKLAKKVDTIIGSRLITDAEITKLNESVSETIFSEELDKKVDKIPNSRLISDLEIAKLENVVDIETFTFELNSKANIEDLNGKVDKVTGERLITNVEALKIASAVVSTDLEAYLLKDTKELGEVMEIPKEEGNFIRFFNENDNTEKKISMTNLILDASNFIYPSYRSLVGIQNGSNSQFKYRGTLIEETAELYIGGLIYPVNIGFAFEGDTIIITGAPIPTSEDIMRLKAIYLT